MRRLDRLTSMDVKNKRSTVFIIIKNVQSTKGNKMNNAVFTDGSQHSRIQVWRHESKALTHV